MLGASEKGHDLGPSSIYLTMGSCAPQGLGGLLTLCLHHLHSKDHLWALFQPQKSPTFLPSLTLSFLTHHILTHHIHSLTHPHPPHTFTHHIPSPTAHSHSHILILTHASSPTTHPHPPHTLRHHTPSATTHPHLTHTHQPRTLAHHTPLPTTYSHLLHSLSHTHPPPPHIFAHHIPSPLLSLSHHTHSLTTHAHPPHSQPPHTLHIFSPTTLTHPLHILTITHPHLPHTLTHYSSSATSHPHPPQSLSHHTPSATTPLNHHCPTPPPPSLSSPLVCWVSGKVQATSYTLRRENLTLGISGNQ